MAPIYINFIFIILFYFLRNFLIKLFQFINRYSRNNYPNLSLQYLRLDMLLIQLRITLLSTFFKKFTHLFFGYCHTFSLKVILSCLKLVL